MRSTPREVCRLVKNSFKLTELQRAVLVGTLLGDGGLRFRGKDCRLHVKHSLTQISLVSYKRDVFASITSMKTRIFKQKVGKKNYNFAEFVTLTHPFFTDYYHQFYRSGRKIVPKNIKQSLIDPLSLAIWLMDDGAAEYAGVSLQTHSFTEAEVKKLIRVLKENFKLKATKRLNKGKWIIYFPKSVLPKLEILVRQYLLLEFHYKIEPYSKRDKPRRDCTPGPSNIRGI